MQFSVRAEVGVGYSLRIAGNHPLMGRCGQISTFAVGPLPVATANHSCVAAGLRCAGRDYSTCSWIELMWPRVTCAGTCLKSRSPLCASCAPPSHSWDVQRSVPLSYVNGRWAADLQLPCGRVYEYKYVVVKTDSGALVSWQPGADSVLSVFREDSLLQVCRAAHAQASVPLHHYCPRVLPSRAVDPHSELKTSYSGGGIASPCLGRVRLPCLSLTLIRWTTTGPVTQRSPLSPQSSSARARRARRVAKPAF